MRWFRRSETVDDGAQPQTSPAAVNPGYVLEPPTPQTQLDLHAGEWTSGVPVEGVSGPRPDLFDDERIAWAIEQLGPIDGWDVLELGPLEAGHTTMLERAGARVTAVEASAGAFQRCLVVKNLLALRARFELGDFVAYLEREQHTWDLCVACGVLYHMTDPVHVLELLGARARRLQLWTHYYDADVNERRPDVADRFAGTRALTASDGATVTGHVYEYRDGITHKTFCGGPRPTATWLEKDTLLGTLERLGFDDVRVQFDDPDSAHGPSIALVASRA